MFPVDAPTLRTVFPVTGERLSDYGQLEEPGEGVAALWCSFCGMSAGHLHFFSGLPEWHSSQTWTMVACGQIGNLMYWQPLKAG